MAKYRVEVCQEVCCIDYGWIEVEAAGEEEARAAALDKFKHNGWGFSLKSEQIDAKEPYTDEVREITE
jgi:hypothetical protein